MKTVGSLKMRVPLIKVILSIVVLVRGGSENGVVVSSPEDDLASLRKGQSVIFDLPGYGR